ncbi:hypothetical protein [Microvirga terricola]|uniref:Major facilitator superfamily (MFS) profile domain-containing protein n=1 Tax=Microvirga terricola TaxID=2719797 RepID=A0ABX0VDA5_9HYPH|nr:hypothetical protein [Microvirga terricola]NIX77647.1 hypothetical protein [Microvirga terricola]
MLVQIAFKMTLVLAVCGWIGTLIGAALSVMAFDAPGSQSRWQAWAFVGGMILLTLASLAAIIAAKTVFQNDRVMLAFVLLAVPALAGAVFVAMRFLT